MVSSTIGIPIGIIIGGINNFNYQGDSINVVYAERIDDLVLQHSLHVVRITKFVAYGANLAIHKDQPYDGKSYSLTEETSSVSTDSGISTIDDIGGDWFKEGWFDMKQEKEVEFCFQMHLLTRQTTKY